MGVQAFQLRDDHANVPGARGRRQAGQPLHRLAKCKRVDVGADAADPLHQRDDLNVVARLGQMLDAAKVETDVQLGIDHGFAFANHVELVRFFESRMIRPHGDLVAHLFSLLGATASRRLGLG